MLIFWKKIWLMEEHMNKQIPISALEARTGEVAIYNPDDSIKLEVRLEQDNVWLDRSQIAALFGRDKTTIEKHINNALKEELKDVPTAANFAALQKEGNRWVNRYKEFFNLDMILSVGYRVHSSRGIVFRRWANNVLKEYLMRGYVVNSRLEQLEKRVARTEERIDFFVKTALPPVEGIFFDGQLFDAYEFVCGLIKRAKERIVLIDNYVDDSVLTMLDNKMNGVEATIYTMRISKQFQLALDLHNKQYPSITVSLFTKAHDRFLIIDNDVYHIGASLKDLGKKWFAFSLMEQMDAEDLLFRL